MDKNMFAELNINKKLLEICPDEKTVNDVSNDLQTLQQDKSVIIQRQREIADFVNNPNLLNYLQRLIVQFDELKEQHKMERLSITKSRVQSAYNTPRERIKPIMSNMLMVVKHAEACVKLYNDLPVDIQDFVFTSDIFVGFKDSLKKIINGKNQAKLKLFIKDIQTLQSASPWHQSRIFITYTMDSSLSKLFYRISQLLFDVTPSSVGRRIFFFRDDRVINILRRGEAKRKDEEFAIAENFFSQSMIGSLTHLMDILSLFISNLHKPLEYIQKHLSIYKFGVSLAARFKTQGTPYCFPEITAPGVHTSYNQPLILRYGDAGTDHFQFTQECVLLQLFAQAGFPIAAEQAQVAIVSGLFVQLSSNELILGRFEEEVREMSALCRKIKPHGMILFHEVFQSTAYEDIAEPFAKIVEYLIALPCTVVLVTQNDFLAEQLMKFQQNG